MSPFTPLPQDKEVKHFKKRVEKVAVDANAVLVDAKAAAEAVQKQVAELKVRREDGLPAVEMSKHNFFCRSSACARWSTRSPPSTRRPCA